MKKLRIFLPFYRKIIKRMSKGYGIGKTKPGRLILKIITYMFRSDFVEVQGHNMFLHPGGADYSLYGVYGELDTEIVKREIKKGDIVVDIGDSILKNKSLKIFFEWNPEYIKVAGDEPEEVLNLLYKNDFKIYSPDHKNQKYTEISKNQLLGVISEINLLCKKE